MSTEHGKRQRRRSTRVRRASKTPAVGHSTRIADRESDASDAREHYRREKERRAHRTRAPEHPLEQARRAYHALLAADAERAKGGRPKKTTAPATKRTKEKGEDAAADFEE